MEAYASPDLDKARALMTEAGYRGEPITVLHPTDNPILGGLSQVTIAQLRRIGVNVDVVAQDLAAAFARRANRQPPAQGGWNLHNTNGPAATIANPAVSFAIRMNGQAAWPGWPSDAAVEEQVEAWINATDADTQAQAMRRLQELAWDAVPFAPTGLFRLRTAFRADISGVLQGPNPFVWNLRRG